MVPKRPTPVKPAEGQPGTLAEELRKVFGWDGAPAWFDDAGLCPRLRKPVPLPDDWFLRFIWTLKQNPKIVKVLREILGVEEA
jgi:hypothetical protein